MAEAEKNRRRDYSRFDKMSTGILKEILLRDSYLNGQEDMDTDAIVYIMEVIRKREEEDPEAGTPDVDEAWASFNRNYRPCAGEMPLYADDDEDGCTAEELPAPSGKSGKRKLVRFAAAVAAVCILVFTGTVTAYALGFDLWGRIISWTDETFNLTSDTVRNAEIKTKELKAALKEAGIDEGWAPSYIPDGYEQSAFNQDHTDVGDLFTAVFEKDDNAIIIEIQEYQDPFAFIEQYQKDENNPEIYTYKDIGFYIMTNFNEYLATWRCGNIQGGIYGVESKDELINMIESIEVVE